VCPAAIGQGQQRRPATVRHPVGAGVEEEAEEALHKLREEAAWSTWVEEGGNIGAL
jgi:hypothetical protein